MTEESQTESFDSGSLMDTSANVEVSESSESESVESTKTSETSETSEASEPEGWEWSEGVKGEGEPPTDWEKSKYKYPSEQLKAYKELRKKLSGFTGAPEQYEFDASKYGEDYAKIAPMLDPDGEKFKSFVAVAKESNMNQDTFNKCCDEYVDGEKAKLTKDNEIIKEYQTAELKKLGDKPQERLKKFQTWALQNLEGFDEKRVNKLMLNSDMIEAIDQIRSKIPNVKVTAPSTASKPGLSGLEVHNIYADPRYKNDMEYRRKVQPLLTEYYKNK